MNHPKPDTILQRAAGISIRIVSADEVEISLNESKIVCSNHCLPILEVFARPVAVREALPKLRAAGAYDWMRLTDSIKRLCQLGALREPSENEFVPEKEFWDFGSAPVHIAMLNDRTRTEMFAEALREIVRAGDVVVDIGTGTGVLAIAAARAGARRVFAVEAGAMAGTARKIMDETEVGEKIEIIRGWSTQIELPEKANVLVGEVIGNDPFAENILPVFKDARQRLLAPNVKIIPSRLKVFGLPVELSPMLLANRLPDDEAVGDWKKWYKIDFSRLKDNVDYKSQPLLNLKTEAAGKLNFLGEPLLLADVEFSVFDELSIRKTVETKLSKAGVLNGLLIYFEIALGSKTLSTHPKIAAADTHWLNPVWYLPAARAAKIGDSFTFGFSYNEKGNNSEVVLLDDSAAAQE